MKSIKKREAVKFFQSRGWTLKRQHGKHDIWVSPDGRETLAMPRHTEVPPGIVRQIKAKLGNVPQGWN